MTNISFIYLGEGLNNGPIHQVFMCKISDEFDGVNHKTSHDGLLKVRSVHVRQEILDEIDGIRVTLKGQGVRNKDNE